MVRFLLCRMMDLFLLNTLFFALKLDTDWNSSDCAGHPDVERVVDALGSSGLIHKAGIATSVKETGQQWSALSPPYLGIIHEKVMAACPVGAGRR